MGHVEHRAHREAWVRKVEVEEVLRDPRRYGAPSRTGLFLHSVQYVHTVRVGSFPYSTLYKAILMV